eukprot:scaffold421241_cov56-Attheya_sp.AAC.1
MLVVSSSTTVGEEKKESSAMALETVDASAAQLTEWIILWRGQWDLVALTSTTHKSSCFNFHGTESTQVLPYGPFLGPLEQLPTVPMVLNA